MNETPFSSSSPISPRSPTSAFSTQALSHSATQSVSHSPQSPSHPASQPASQPVPAYHSTRRSLQPVTQPQHTSPHGTALLFPSFPLCSRIDAARMGPPSAARASGGSLLICATPDQNQIQIDPPRNTHHPPPTTHHPHPPLRASFDGHPGHIPSHLSVAIPTLPPQTH
jgi:hypothetical protein